MPPPERRHRGAYPHQSNSFHSTRAARFLYEQVLGRERARFAIPLAKAPTTQPELLAREEIARLFGACAHPVYRMLLQTLYATGLRISEACALRLADIDSHSDRMCIRVVCGKGGKDRYTLLSASLLDALRIYARSCRAQHWLLCNRIGSEPVTISSAQRAYQGARRRAGIHKSGGPAHASSLLCHAPARKRR